MTVYVDDAAIPRHGMIMSHMAADSLDELHAMADRIGLNRSWFQEHKRVPHYDVSASKKALAIKYGAREVDSRALLLVMSRKY
jgi:hypothetical protein